MTRCACCNQPTRPPASMCQPCHDAGCTRLTAQPTTDDPHLTATTGLNAIQRRARHRYHQQQLHHWRSRTGDIPTAHLHVEHHQHQITRFAYRSTR